MNLDYPVNPPEPKKAMGSTMKRALLRQECDRLALSIAVREQLTTYAWGEVKRQVRDRLGSPPVMIGVAAGAGLLIGMRRRPFFAKFWPGWPALGRVAMLLWSAHQASQAAEAAEAAENAVAATETAAF